MATEQAKQVSESELQQLRDNILRASEKARKTRVAKLLLSLIFEVTGYIILLLVDWRIAVAIFLLQWAFELKLTRTATR